MVSAYVELHSKSFYSFGLGASHTHELLAQAREYGYPALALTDTNLCGALEFARAASSLGVQPITGGEFTLTDGSRLVLLAETRKGYANISSRLFTCANESDRKEPRLDPRHLPEHSEGVILLTGGRDGQIARLVLDGHYEEAHLTLQKYLEWFGGDSVFIELQQNLIHGDTRMNQRLIRLAGDMGVPVIATNDVHYHSQERHRLQNALVAVKHNTTIDQALMFLRPSPDFYLKSQAGMQRLFRSCPEAIANTLRIAERCAFNLSTDLGYTLPEPAVPEGYTPESYLRQLCYEAAVRRYGSISSRVEGRLESEFHLIRRHRLAGFLLLYREIVQLAQQIMVEHGLIDPETPVEERPPGRGRGSSVALLVGYLIGISHIDPLVWDLTLERFLPEDMHTLPDIDLDFPRGLRDELIRRIHQHFGSEHAVLTGAITTYRMRSVPSGHWSCLA
jgi:error-prone DNA polymerase